MKCSYKRTFNLQTKMVFLSRLTTRSSKAQLTSRCYVVDKDFLLENLSLVLTFCVGQISNTYTECVIFQVQFTGIYKFMSHDNKFMYMTTNRNSPATPAGS